MTERTYHASDEASPPTASERAGSPGKLPATATLRRQARDGAGVRPDAQQSVDRAATSAGEIGRAAWRERV